MIEENKVLSDSLYENLENCSLEQLDKFISELDASTARLDIPFATKWMILRRRGFKTTEFVGAIAKKADCSKISVYKFKTGERSSYAVHKAMNDIFITKLNIKDKNI